MKYTSRRGFTLVEILVVIAVILLLVGLMVAGTSHVFTQQKARNTQAMMQSLTAAIEQFRQTNPLRNLYDVRGRETFGSLPPYQLDLDRPANLQKSAAYAFEANPPSPTGISGPNLFSDRIARDLGCRDNDIEKWWEVDVTSGPIPRIDDEHMDNRGLYAYMKAFTPGILASVPEANIKRIPHSQNATAVFHMNQKGRSSGTGHADHVDVLGFVDGWGVPIDYMVMAKYEWALVREQDGVERARYKVVDRQVVLRSRGMDEEKYKTWVATDPASPRQRAANLIDVNASIYSAELSKPWANADPVTGRFLSPTGSETQGNGWLRVVGKLDEYNYRPN